MPGPLFIGTLGAPEIAIIAGIIILIFGVGKISGLGRELGSSIKEFRRAVKDEGKEAEDGAPAPPVQSAQQAVPPPPPVQQAASSPPPEPVSRDSGSRNVF